MAVRTVVVTAAAGCGKTYEAASLAVDLQASLVPGQAVLFLAHTNAAVGELRERVRKRGGRIHASTFDAFALEVVARYATALGLPHPIIPNRTGTSFRELEEKLAELLARCPQLTRLLARRYPVVMLDEHQDANMVQHRIAETLRDVGGAALRIFGDPLQDIYGSGETVGWEALARSAERHASLTDPHRWTQEPRLGNWIAQAREELSAGRGLLLSSIPACVTVRTIEGISEPWVRRPPRQIVAPLQNVLNMYSAGESVAVLARTNDQVFGIRVASNNRLRIHEGADLDAAENILAQAVASVGNASTLSVVALQTIQVASTRFDKSKMDAAIGCLEAAGIRYGRQQVLRPLLDAMAPLYDDPSLTMWASCVRRVVLAPPPWLRIHLPELLLSLGELRTSAGHDPHLVLEAAMRTRRSIGRRPHWCTSTIHRSKGHQFDHVVVAYCGAKSFPADDAGRRLLYTAITRATRSIVLMVPGTSPSPLVVSGGSSMAAPSRRDDRNAGRPIQESLPF